MTQKSRLALERMFYSNPVTPEEVVVIAHGFEPGQRYLLQLHEIPTDKDRSDIRKRVPLVQSNMRTTFAFSGKIVTCATIATGQ